MIERYCLRVAALSGEISRIRFTTRKQIMTIRDLTTISRLEKAAAPNSCQYIAKSVDRGDFLVQVAWPLAWSEDGNPPEDDPTPQTLYVVPDYSR